MGVEELANAEEELRALRERDGAPRLPGLRGVPHGRVDLLDRREVDRTGLRARGGVVDRPAAAGRPVDALPPDPVGNPCDRSVASFGRRLGKLRHRSLLSRNPCPLRVSRRGPHAGSVSGRLRDRFLSSEFRGSFVPIAPRCRAASEAVLCQGESVAASCRLLPSARHDVG